MTTLSLRRPLALKLGLTGLALSLSALSYAAYKSYLQPLTGYGDEGMSEITQADPRALSGGDLTNFHKGVLPFEQEAPNLPWRLLQQFDRGDGLFEIKFSPALPSRHRFDVDGVGPLFNETSCAACHVSDGRAAPPAKPGEPMLGMFLRMSTPNGQGGWRAPAGYHAQLHDRALDGVPVEGIGRVKYEEAAGRYPDGAPYRLAQPHYRIESPGYGPLNDPAMIVEARVAPPNHGLGLLEAISEQDILALALTQQRAGEVSGRPNRLTDPESGKPVIGRFSWKANAPSLRAQVAGAAFNDMGVTSPIHRQQNCEPNQTACRQARPGGSEAAPEMSEQQLQDLTTYLQLLSVPARRNLNDPQALRGETLFQQVNCVACHQSTWKTGQDHPLRRLRQQTIHPYTDLLLHDMGPALAGRPDGVATQSEWRTPPLWGIGLTQKSNGHTRFLHDGRARNLEEAILWHGGEADKAKQRFMALNKEDRAAVLQFLQSL